MNAPQNQPKIYEKFPTLIPSSIASIMLLLAIPKFWPYGYYTILRIVVCGCGIWLGIAALGAKKIPLIVIAGAIIILFNPIIPVYLEKETWVVIDVIVALIMFISIWFIKASREKQ